MEEHNNFFSMNFTLGDLIPIIGYISGLVMLYIIIRDRVTRLEIRQDAIKESIAKFEAAIANNKVSVDRDNRYIFEKIALIESSQVKTNTFLEENLKNLTQIIQYHEKEIEQVKAKLQK